MTIQNNDLFDNTNNDNSNTPENIIKNRREILFLYDISYANPNGDPNDENKPRTDEETGKNIVTDVRLKRTVRDYLKNFKNEKIFISELKNEDGTIKDAKARARDFLKENKDIKENITTAKVKIANAILKQCIDVRLFGATIPLEIKKKKDSITYTGPVQFNMGQSLHRVKLEFIKGTGAFASKEGAHQNTFREEWILPYSLIAFHGLVNENAAKETDLTEKDIEKLREALWKGTKNLISRSKAGQMPRLYLEIIYKENESSHLGDIHKYIKLQSDKNDETLRDPEDYILNVDKLVKLLSNKKDIIEKIAVIKDERLKLTQELKINDLTVEELSL